MKFSKYLLATAASMAVSGVFAEKLLQEDVILDNDRTSGNTAIVYFETMADIANGIYDKYADGTMVKDGEWYVLCWSPNETFGGLNLDCTPAVDGDLVLRAIPWAKDGHCREIALWGKNPNSGGSYFVYVLDTRTPDRTALAEIVSAEGIDATVFPRGKPAFVNGASEADKPSIYVAGNAWAESSANNVDPFSQARISEIKVDDASGLVDLTVVGMMPNVQYNVQMGQKIEGVGGAALQKTYAVKIPKTEAEKDAEGKVYFQIPKEEAKFFRVVRQPLDLPVDAE